MRLKSISWCIDQKVNNYLVNTFWHGLGHLWLRSPANGAEPALKACTDNTLKSGTYLSHGGTLSLGDRCLDQALIIDALEKSDQLIGSFRTVQNPVQVKG